MGYLRQKKVRGCADSEDHFFHLGDFSDRTAKQEIHTSVHRVSFRKICEKLNHFRETLAFQSHFEHQRYICVSLEG